MGGVSDAHRDTHHLDLRSMVQIERASSLFLRGETACLEAPLAIGIA